MLDLSEQLDKNYDNIHCREQHEARWNKSCRATPICDRSYERSGARRRARSRERPSERSCERRGEKLIAQQNQKLREFELSVNEERKENFAVPCTPKVRARRPVTIGASPPRTARVKTPPMSSLLGTNLSSRLQSRPILKNLGGF